MARLLEFDVHANSSLPPALNINLLNQLRAAGGHYVPLDQLAPDLPMLHHDLEGLIRFGFGIEQHPLHGVAFHSPSARLCPDQIEFELGTKIVGRRIAVWNEVASTNDLALRASRSNANDGLVVLAEAQTAGRGRRGRSWVAPPRSSILMSVLLFPPATIGPAGDAFSTRTTWITALAAVAVTQTVSRMIGRHTHIKWPNDVRVAGRKIAGILVEQPLPIPARPAIPITHTDKSRSEIPVVIGIGLNVNLTPERFPAPLADIATSVWMEVNQSQPLDRSEIARSLIQDLDHWYHICLERGLEALSSAWSSVSEHLNRAVRIETHDRSYTGHVIDLDLERGLTLDTYPARPNRAAPSQDATVHIPLPQILSLTAEDLSAKPASPSLQATPPRSTVDSPKSPESVPRQTLPNTMASSSSTLSESTTDDS